MGSRRTLMGADNRQEKLDDALWVAIQNANPEEAEHLLRAGASPESRRGEYGETVLIWATDLPTLDIMALLIKRGANINTPDFDGLTPLMYAAANEMYVAAYKPLELLLQHGAKVDLSSNSGTTALMFAAEAGTMRSVYRLLKAGANPDLRTDDGQTAYDIAMSRHYSLPHRRIAELLRRHMK
jgi:uncharacterized protein